MFEKQTAGSLLMIQTGNKDLLLTPTVVISKDILVGPGMRQKYSIERKSVFYSK